MPAVKPEHRLVEVTGLVRSVDRALVRAEQPAFCQRRDPMHASRCPMKPQCTPSDYRRISRWEHEAVLDAMQRRLDQQPEAMTLRRRTVEHVFGTLKYWMGSTHFLTRRLPNVATEMSLQVLAYNLKRVMNILGIARTMKVVTSMGA